MISVAGVVYLGLIYRDHGKQGPCTVEVRVAGQAAETGHPRQRAVLAVLLLDLGRVVPTELLIDRVWGGNPPASG
jgi:DNA-binding response OmpR family regulator